MPNEILIYSEIDSWSSAQFIRELNEVHGQDIDIRIASNGGNPEYVWGMAAKFQEHEGNKTVKVDGKAHSTLSYFLALVDESQALDVATMVIHRAAYSKWAESSEDFMTDDRIASLTKINKDLKNALAAKIDVDKFNDLKEVKDKGITFNDIFSLDARHEITLSAQDAKKIGLINKIVKITPTKKAEIKTLSAKHSNFIERVESIAAHYTPESNNNSNNNSNKQTDMDIQELKAKYPSLCNEIKKEGFDSGIKAEHGRVSTLMVYIGVDPKAVIKHIKDKTEVDSTLMAEFNLSATKLNSKKSLAADNADDLDTNTPNDDAAPNAGKSEGGLSAEEFKNAEALIDKGLGINAKKD